MAKVEVEVRATQVLTDRGNLIPGVAVCCTRCGHEVKVAGETSRSVRRGCAMLREECPEGEENYYHDPEGDDG